MKDPRYRFPNHANINGLYVPRDLRQGDIVLCSLPTDWRQNGRRENCPRNVMILGIGYEPKWKTPTGIFTVRLSYNLDKFNPDHEILCEPSSRGGPLTQLETSILRTNRIDFIPFDSVYEDCLWVRGRMDASAFKQIDDALERGRHAPNAETSRIASVGEQPRHYLSGLPPYINDPYPFNIGPGISLYQPDVYELAEWAARRQTQQAPKAPGPR